MIDHVVEEYNGLTLTMDRVNDKMYQLYVHDSDGEEVGRCIGYAEDCSFNGTTVKAFVLGRLYTSAIHRRGGMARKCFQMMDSAIKETGAIVSYLHPFSFPYYRMMGYERVSDHRVLKIHIEDLSFVERYNNLEPIKVGDSAAPLDEVYNKFAQNRNVMLHRFDSGIIDEKVTSPKYQHGMTYQYGLKGMKCYLSRDEEGNPDGYIIMRFEMPLKDHWLKDGILHVEEMCFTSPEGLRKLMGFIRMYEGQYDYVRFANVGMAPEVERLLRRYKYTEISILPDISGRFHDVGAALAANVYPREKGEFTVKVTDCEKSPFSKDLTQGVWHVVYENGKGQVTRLADDAGCDLICDMPAFSQIVHGYESYGMEVAQYMHGVEILGDCRDFFRAFPNRPAGAFDLF